MAVNRRDRWISAERQTEARRKRNLLRKIVSTLQLKPTCSTLPSSKWIILVALVDVYTKSPMFTIFKVVFSLSFLCLSLVHSALVSLSQPNQEFMLLRRIPRLAATVVSSKIMEWLGHAKIGFTTAPEPLELKTKDGKRTDLLRIVEESTPPCRLNPLLFNGHLQTAMTVLKPDGPVIHYKRKIFDAEDPAYEGTFAVDFVVKPFEDIEEDLPPRTAHYKKDELEELEAGSLDSRPMLIALHGLSGGSYEIYLRHVLAPLIQEDGGWEACVVNSRGCAGHKITSSILYNARATWDMRQAVKWLRQKFPNRPLFGIGFSLGANILTNVRTLIRTLVNIC